MKIKPRISKELNLKRFKELGKALLDEKTEEEYLAEAQQIIEEDNLLPEIPVESLPQREPKQEPVPFQKRESWITRFTKKL